VSITKLLLSFSLFFISPSLFAGNYTLPNDQWRLISLPANPPISENTVAKVFGDDISGGVYGNDWVLYQYDPQKNSYGEPLGLGDSLEQGRGYWIFQKTGSPVTLTMPAGSSEAPDTYALNIASVTGSNKSQWTLSGNPFSLAQKLGNFFLKTDSGDCITPCDLDQAKKNQLLHNQVWTYDGSGYVLKNKESELNSWDGFWVASLENSQGFKLSLQKGIASGSHVYVATDGDDSSNNDGKSKSSPLRSIARATALAGSGTTIHIAKGTYSGQVVVKEDGVSYVGDELDAGGDPTTIIDGHRDGVTDRRSNGLFRIEGRKDVNVSNIEFKNSKWAGVYIEGSNGIEVKSNKTDNTASSGIYVVSSHGISIGGERRSGTKNDGNKVTQACVGGTEEAISIALSNNVSVGYNDVSNSGTGAAVDQGGGGEGIDIKDGSHTVYVFNNHVHNNKKYGIYIDAWDKETYDIHVYNNYVHHIDANGIVLASEKSGLLRDINIYNNIVSSNTSNEGGGIYVAGHEALDDKITPPHKGTTKMNDILIANNTVYKNGSDGIYLNNEDLLSVTVVNNLSVDNVSSQIGLGKIPANASVTHNLANGVLPYYQISDNSTNLNVAPAFVTDSPSEPEHFKLKTNPVSPAVNAGTSVAIFNKDYQGTGRPQRGGWDIGALESK